MTEFTFILYHAKLSSKAHTIDSTTGVRFIPKKFPHKIHNRFFVTVEIPDTYLGLFEEDLIKCQEYATDELSRLELTLNQ